MTADSGAELSVTATEPRRYPGVRPFEESDCTQFFGRKESTEALLLRVLSVRLLLQFAPSGAGKTSLLRAGLFPRLRARDCLPVAVRLNNLKETPRDAVVRALRDSVAAAGLERPVIPDSAETLSELLSRVELWGPEVQLLTPVLVFDQFEEIFTLRDEAFRRELAQQIGQLASGRVADSASQAAETPIDVKIILSLREEYLGKLEELSDAIPGLFRERLRLPPLSDAEAREAIVAPAKLDGSWWSPIFEFEEQCLDALIDFIDGVSERARVIEPLTLQLMCQRAETIARTRASDINRPLTLDDFGGTNGLGRLVHDYFNRKIEELPTRAVRSRARRMFEQDLLDPAGKRLMLEQGEIEQGNRLSSDELEALVDARLLRREPRGESIFYEISHDRLADVIAKSRPVRRPKWVMPVAVGLGALVILVSMIAAVFYVKNQTILEARTKTDLVIAFLLGDELVKRLQEAGLSDVVVKVSGFPPDPDGDPLTAALLARRQGEVKMERGTLSAAADLFRQALSLSERARQAARIGASLDAERGQEFKLLGDALLGQGRVSLAKEQYLNAVKFSERAVAARGNPNDVFSAVEAYQALGAVRTREGDWVQAETEYQKAIEKVMPLVTNAYQRVQENPRVQATPPSDAPFALGRALQLYADVTLGMAQIWWTESSEFKGARALAAEVVRARPMSNQAQIQLAIASAIYGTFLVPINGDTWTQKGNEDDELDPALAARALLDESAGQLEEVTNSDSKNRRMQRERAAVDVLVADFMTKCVNSNACRDVLGKLEVRASEARLLDSLGTFQQLAALDESSLDLRIDIAWGLETQAGLSSAQGRHAAALVSIEKALQLRRSLIVDPSDVSTRSSEIVTMLVKTQVLSDLKRYEDASRTLDDATELAARLPKGLARTSRQYDVLSKQATLARSQEHADEGNRLQKQADALLEGIGNPGQTRAERSLALNKEGNGLHEAAAGESVQAGKLDGEAAGAAHRRVAAGYQAAAAKYRQALLATPVDPIIWSNARSACRLAATALASAQTANADASGAQNNVTNEQEDALRCAFESAWLAWVLRDDVRVEDNQRGKRDRFDQLKALYEDRRSLAIYWSNQAGAEEQKKALALAEQGVRDAKLLEVEIGSAAVAESSERFFLADAYFGLGMMREASRNAGWEPSYDAAIVLGMRQQEMEPDKQEHWLWLGGVHRDLAVKLANAGQQQEGVEERTRAIEVCRQALKMAKNDAERSAAQTCIDEAEGLTTQ